MANLIQALGLVGVIMINITYYLISTGRMSPDRYLYPAINFVGASLIIVALVPEWNLPAFLMELSWALISLVALLRTLYFKSRESAQDAE